MNLLDYIISSFNSLMQHKFRSFLTILGVLIGVFAITTVITISKGGKELIFKEFLAGGTNLIMAFNSQMETRMDRLDYLTEDNLLGMKETIPQIAELSPIHFLMTPIKVKGRMKQITVIGCPENFFRLRNIKTSSGRTFTDYEVRHSERVCVVGRELFYELFGKPKALGQEIEIEGVYFRVIGVMKPKLELGPMNLDMAIAIPSSCAQRLLGTHDIYAVQFLVKEGVDTSLVKEKIKDYLRQIFAGRDSFEVVSIDELLSMLNNVMGIISTVLGSIAGVSLLVGGIGIMNIMLVSVRERIREIGIRKAVGATRKDILYQFLIESLVLCLSGGGIGILTSVALVLMISKMMDLAFFVSGQAILLGFGFSFITGIFFGIYPAYLAAKLDPVDALRYE